MLRALIVHSGQLSHPCDMSLGSREVPSMHLLVVSRTSDPNMQCCTKASIYKAVQCCLHYSTLKPVGTVKNLGRV